jgi:hypothetical protein
MVTRAIRAVAWTLIAAAAVFALSGCNNATVKMRLANDGVMPITELLVYPTIDTGSEAQINRLPKDATGSTIALVPNDAVLLDSKFQNKLYDVWVVFYDSASQKFRPVQAPNPLDLTAVKRGSLVILTASMDANKTASITYDIQEENADILSWPGWGFVGGAVAVLLSILLLGPIDL